MTDDVPASALADRPGFLIRRLHQIHVALFAEECATSGITPVQYSLLTVAEARPGLDQARLAHAVGIDRATTAGVLARLQSRGLLRRAPSPTDRRLKLVTLTPRGHRVLRALQAPAARAHARTIEALGPRDRAAFLRALRTLVDAGNGAGRAPLRWG